MNRGAIDPWLLVVYGDVIALSVYELHELHAVNAVHDKSGKFHGESNPGAADPKDLQTNPAHVAGPTVYSCGIRGDKGGKGPGFA